MILVPLPYKLYGFFCLCLNMENLLYKSKSEQGVANLLRYCTVRWFPVPSVFRYSMYHSLRLLSRESFIAYNSLSR